MKIFKAVSIIILSLLFSTDSYSQNDILNKKVSLSFNNKTVEEVLLLLGKEANCQFAYNTELIPVDSVINYQTNDQSVRSVLDQLFNKSISYKERGRFIVLQPAAITRGKIKEPKQQFMIIGRVVDAESKSSIQEASVYITENLKSTITNSAGEFQLEVSNRQLSQTLFISKMGYLDTAITVVPAQGKEMTIQLSKEPALEMAIEDTVVNVATDSVESVEKMRFVKFFTNLKQRINSKNIKEGFKRGAQISVVPMIGTNRRLSGTVTNNFSLNVIAGYNGGIKGVELGLLTNILRNNMIGFQLAGFSNIVGKHSSGMQLSGIFNYTGSDLSGVQLAGILNMVRGKMKGFQLSAINYSGDMRGVQLGVINAAKSASGTPIGLFSFVKKGYHHVDLYGDELNYLNVSFKTGVKHFYNIVSAGWTWRQNPDLWRVGYGLGSAFFMGKNKRGIANIDLSVSFINQGKHFITDLNLLTSFNVDFGVRIHDYFSLFFGPGMKVYNSQYQNPETGNIGLDIGFHPVFENVNDGQLNRIWLGARGGFRF